MTGRRRPPEVTTGELTTIAQSIGFVKENNHTAIPQGEFAQLAEKALHLHHTDAEEHGLEGARVDKDIGFPGLTGDRLRDQCLPGAGRAPQQDAPGHVPAPAFDLLRFLQVEDRFLDPGQNVVLAPHVGEPGLDVLGEVHIHTTAGEEPEQQRKLPDGDKHDKHDLYHERGRPPDIAGQPNDRVEHGVVLDPGVDKREDRGRRHPLQSTADAVAVPVVELEQAALEAAEDPVGPEDVILRRPLADQHVDLADNLDCDQRQQPPARRHLLTHGVGPAHDRIVRRSRGHHEHEQRAEQDEKLHSVPEHQRLAHRRCRLRLRGHDGADRGRLRRRGLIHVRYLR